MASIEDSWFLSAKQGRDDDLKELLSQIGDINKKDNSGNTGILDNYNLWKLFTFIQLYIMLLEVII